MRLFVLFLRRNLLVGLGGTVLLLAVFGLGVPPASAAPLAQVGSVSITCTYYSDYDRQFDVTFEPRAGGAPSGTALLTNVDGTTTTQSSFTNQTTLRFRGPYLELEIDATWPDGATGFAAATCGRAVQPTATATRVAPTATRVAPTATRTAPSATATNAAPTATAPAATATATTVPPAATTVAPATAVPPTATRTTPLVTSVPPPIAEPTAEPVQPTVVEATTPEPIVQPTVVEATTPEPPHSDIDPTAVVATAVPATAQPTAPAAIAPNQGQQPSAAPAQAPAARPKAPVAQPKAAPVALPVTSSNGDSGPWLMLVLGGMLLLIGGLRLRRQPMR